MWARLMLGERGMGWIRVRVRENENFDKVAGSVCEGMKGKYLKK